MNDIRDHLDARLGELADRVDARLDTFEKNADARVARLESKFDAFVEKQAARSVLEAKEDATRDERIESLRGFVRQAIVVFLSVCGVLALGYLHSLGGKLPGG